MYLTFSTTLFKNQRNILKSTPKKSLRFKAQIRYKQTHPNPQVIVLI